MARVKGGTATKRIHKKIKHAVKGFGHTRRASYRKGKEAILKAWSQKFAGRKMKKRSMRSLWITRINAKAHELGISYRELINKLGKNKIILDRKILAQLAVEEPKVFKEIIKSLK
ncbi:MAG: 50S ribosomal protein L20 [Patescibacteria group bacterium]|nr:50S ribosomal protein L20 [Patescibacteria group bacterium]